MVRTHNCSFCGYDIPIGRGLMYVKRDGSILHFCCNKCRKAMLDYKKNPRKTRWTKFYGKE
ncbi:MAG: 50S ribosomal protein L24e [Candidatus Lokiarchaeota archaeon]|nr:50S ribosomal protein L24e [Candidatus Lokiarchaeota archaeon]MBD3199154.1 50S ribosomal protein L24e [Candidatus Lokiarchaeota archaeon]